MNWLKQLLCKHIWKEMQSEKIRRHALYELIISDYQVLPGVGEKIGYKQYYATTIKCVLCGKVKIEETWDEVYE
jgi:hypothetical protein